MAIFALVPLRFVELGNVAKVLGESTVVGSENEIILPSAEVDEVIELEAPYYNDAI